MPDNIKNALEIVPVRWIDQVLSHALERTPQPLPPTPPAEGGKTAEAEGAKTSQNLRAH